MTSVGEFEKSSCLSLGPLFMDSRDMLLTGRQIVEVIEMLLFIDNTAGESLKDNVVSLFLPLFLSCYKSMPLLRKNNSTPRHTCSSLPLELIQNSNRGRGCTHLRLWTNMHLAGESTVYLLHLTNRSQRGAKSDMLGPVQSSPGMKQFECAT